MKKLPRSFYTRPTLLIAKDLLGKILVRKIGKTILSGKIVEVEAYRGANDPASHAYRGKTKRNEVMFGEGGYLYVYFTYGMHFCANVVTGTKDAGEAVLIRAIEPIEGIETMRRNRNRTKQLRNEVRPHQRSGKIMPGTWHWTKRKRTDLLGNEIFLTEGESIWKSDIGTSVRIGISRGKDKRWRFYIKNNDWDIASVNFSIFLTDPGTA